MKSNDNLHPLWEGFLDLVRSICAIEIGIYLYYSLVMSGKMFP
jgi:hypothetical protein